MPIVPATLGLVATGTTMTFDPTRMLDTDTCLVPLRMTVEDVTE